MKNKKRWLALGLVGIMTLGCFAGCGSKSDGKSADGKGDSSKGSVYYLNFKPEQDEQWQQLAKDYTKETGVDVTVVTAASGNYETTLMSEMGKQTGKIIATTYQILIFTKNSQVMIMH